MKHPLDHATCARLQQQLREAEEQTHRALQDASDHDGLRTAARLLLETQREIRELAWQADGSAAAVADQDSALAEAAIAIGREEHELKPEVKDILKAVFMWKDNPRERAGAHPGH